VPVTVTVALPVAVNVQDRVDVPEPPVTVAGVRVQAVLSDVKAMSAVNPLSGETVMVESPAELTATVTLVGVAVTVKSGAPVMV
jgi:hypothetical protein